MQRKARLFRMLGIIGIAIFAVCFTGCRHSCPSDRADRMIRYVTDELKLTDAQQTLLVTIKDELAERRAEARKRRELAQPIIMEELQKDAIDQERLLNLYRESKPRMDDFAEYAVSRFAEFHASLSPEQKAILIEKIQKLKKWHTYFAD